MQATNYDTLMIVILVTIFIGIILFFLFKKFRLKKNEINDIKSIITSIKYFMNTTIKEKDWKKLKVCNITLIVVIFSWVL